MNKLVKAIKNPRIVLSFCLHKLSPLIKDDATFVKLEYYLNTGRHLNLDNPIRFNDKLQWLKLNDRNPEHSLLVDKYEVKQIVASRIGAQYIIPVLGLWEKFDDIDFDKLPNQFVLKCTHDSGGLVICTDKSTLDIEAARLKINKFFKRRYFYEHREYPYKNVKPRIMAEEYMVDESGWQLKDYKIFCFNGEPKFIEVDYDRYVHHKLNVYDLDWNYIDFYMTSHNDPNVHIERPSRLEEMLQLAKVLAKGETFVRVDFYSIKDKLYFGELTFHPGAGMIDFHPDEYDVKLGKMLNLPLK